MNPSETQPPPIRVVFDGGDSAQREEIAAALQTCGILPVPSSEAPLSSAVDPLRAPFLTVHLTPDGQPPLPSGIAQISLPPRLCLDDPTTAASLIRSIHDLRNELLGARGAVSGYRWRTREFTTLLEKLDTDLTADEKRGSSLITKLRDAVDSLFARPGWLVASGLRRGKRFEPLDRAIHDLEQESASGRPAKIRKFIAEASASLTERPVEDPPVPRLQYPSVEIVICVHNAPEDTARCLQSVERHSPKAVTIIVVDDGSGAETAGVIDRFAASTRVPTKVIRNESARGYTIAANQGLKATRADIVILLNSDTIVPFGWTERIARCLESSPSLGLASPLSNAASWQSVPERHDADGDWMVNELPDGFTIDGIQAEFALGYQPSFPRTKLLNGFCLAITRKAMDTVGLLDEKTFPQGYGEETDYCLRADEHGLELAIVDDCYVFHAKSKSFGHSKRKELSASTFEIVQKRHGASVIRDAMTTLDKDPALAKARAAFPAAPPSSPRLRVLFILHGFGLSGGVHSVVQEACGLRDLGAYVQVAVPSSTIERYYETYPDVPQDVFMPYYVAEDLIAYAGNFDLAIATLFSTVRLLERIVAQFPEVTPGYYIQDYEPLFFEPETPEWHEARDSYSLIPGLLRFAKTQWIIDEVEREHSVEVHKVSPSIDTSVYSPAESSRPDGAPIRISAMIRPGTPRRAAGLTWDVLTELASRFGDKVSITVFGCDPEDPFWDEVKPEIPFENRGQLVREEVAEVLRESDLFLDLSVYQAFGRTALEAMACGCAAVVPRSGGAAEYAIDGENALVVDTSDRTAILAAVTPLIEDGEQLLVLRQKALESAANFSVGQAAQSELALFRRILSTPDEASG